MTYGALKSRLVQMFPGVSLDLLEGFINDRYAEILGELPWSRQNATAILQTVAPYTTGTLTLTNNSAAVAGAGTTFTSVMTGRALRITGRDEEYQFLYTSGTVGSLDRAYEGPTGTGLSYKIIQSVYPLPADCRMLEDGAFDGFTYGPLTRFDRSQLDASDPARNSTGVPQAWVSYMDDSSTPPRMQVEVWPVPDRVYSIPFTYQIDSGELSGTSTIIQAWIEPGALLEGAISKVKAHLGDYTGAAFHASAAKVALAGMRSNEARGLPPAQMQLSKFYTRHRAARWSR